MISKKLTFSALLSVLFASAMPSNSHAAQKGGLDETGPYDVVQKWFKPGVDGWNQRPASVFPDTPDRIIVGFVDKNDTRAGFPMLAADGSLMPQKTTVVKDEADLAKGHVNMIVVLNRDGKIVENWKQWDAELGLAHSLAISPYDPQRHVWVVDRFNHQVLKLTNDGKKLVQRIGSKGVPGNDGAHFHDPAGIAFAPDGSFYVADGYTNTRIAKFDKNGKFQLAWGSPGNQPGQFNLPHSVSVGPNGNVYVSDRSNARIQVFDQRGQFLDQWPAAHATQILATEDQALWIASAIYGRMAKFDLNGMLLTYWGSFGSGPGQFDNPHQWNVDKEGNLYVAESNNNRVEKFVPKQDADKSRLVAQPYTFNGRK